MDTSRSKVPACLLAIHRTDVRLFYWVTRRRHLPRWSRIWRELSRSADGYLYPVAGMFAWYWAEAQGQLFATALLLSFLIERPLYFILKRGLKRSRPASALPGYHSFIVPADQFSFPSGHSSGAFVIATLMLLFFPTLAWLALIWASLVGASRVALGVHFPTDILAGMFMGVSVASLCAAWVN